MEKQVERVKLLSSMVDEELDIYLTYYKEYQDWQEKKPLDWRNKPCPEVPKSKLKDRMKLLRQETIKLEKML